ncbi:MAG: hypothetical protein LBV26_06530 [Bacteroidales bacterium]|jgi:hypothetical protein|nr:hypothetical protein [Bacteroidales bacterium]
MKRNILKHAAAALVVAAVAFAGCRKDDPQDGQTTMTMTTAKADVMIRLAGVGKATIDWGDGSEPQAVIFSPLARSPDIYSHNYSGASARTITVSGHFITHLHCYGNGLTALDAGKNTTLIELYCNFNNLTALDVSKNTALKILYCYNNNLTALDVSKNTALTQLYCNNNNLTALDVSKSTTLINLRCQSNKFTAEGLNALFGTLHGNPIMSKSIYIMNNPGTADCDQGIATGKEWIVDATFDY